MRIGEFVPGTRVPMSHSRAADSILERRRWWIVLTVAALSCGLRIAVFAQSAEGPTRDQHRWDQTDMHFFDAWGRAIAAGDLLSRDVSPPLHAWHRAVAAKYLEAYPEDRAALEQAGAGDPVAGLWQTWVGGGRFYQEPLYPYLVGATYALFGPEVRAVFAWQLVLGVATNLLLLALAWRLFGPVVGSVAGLLAALYGPMVQFEIVLVKESLVVFATAGLLLLLHDVAERGSWRRLVGTGFALGLAVLLKTLFLPFALLATGVLAGHAAWSGRSLWRTMALVLLGIGLALAPLVARNLAVGAPPFSVYSAGGPTFALGGTYEPAAGPGSLRVRVVHEIVHDTGGATLSTVWRTLQTYPSLQALGASMAGKLASCFFWYEEPDNTNFYHYQRHVPALRLMPVGFAAIAPLGLIGLLLSLRRRPIAILPALCMIALNVGVLALYMVRDRYRLPLVPALLPFAAFAPFEVARLAREGRLVPVGASVVAAAALTVWMARPLPEGKPRVQPAYDQASVVVHYQPRAKAALEAGRPKEAVEILEGAIHRAPGFLRDLGKERSAQTEAQAGHALLQAAVHDLYAHALDRDDRPVDSMEASRRAETLRRAARAWAAKR